MDDYFYELRYQHDLTELRAVVVADPAADRDSGAERRARVGIGSDRDEVLSASRRFASWSPSRGEWGTT